MKWVRLFLLLFFTFFWQQSIFAKVNSYRLKPIITSTGVDNALKKSIKLKAKPNIIIFLVDTLRKDYVLSATTPNIHEFYTNNINFSDNYANGVTTYFSTTAFFFSMHAIVRPQLVDHSDYDRGALNLRLLKHAGYQIHLYSRSNNYYCFNDGFQSQSGQYENSKYLFTSKPKSFLTDCTEYKGVPKKQRHLFPYAVQDNTSITRFISSSTNILKDRPDGNVFIILLDGVHTPYSWVPAVNEKLITPYFQEDVASETMYSAEHHIPIRNRYKNGTISADYQFGRAMNHLKSLDAYDDSLIFLFSDHGERLFNDNYIGDDKTKTAHSGIGYDALIRNVMALKFPKLSKDQERELAEHNKAGNSVGLKDIFPTIFDYLGLAYPDYFDDFIIGQSLFEDPGPYCQANYAPNWSNPPYFTFVQRLRTGKRVKVFVKVDRPSWDHKYVSFKIMHVIDDDDSEALSVFGTRDYWDDVYSGRGDFPAEEYT